MSSHDELRQDLGVYVLGALDRETRDRLDRHLARCQDCREELARLAVLPGLLQHIRDAGVGAPSAAGLDDAGADGSVPPVEPVLARIAAQRRRSRRRWVASLGGVAAAALVAIALVLSPWQRAPASVAFAASGGTAAATVSARPWGMAVELHADVLPPADGYQLVAVAADGHTTAVASWQRVDHPMHLEGACYLRPEQVRRLEIRPESGGPLVAVLEPQA